jgi:hypothetical protein
MLAVLLQQEHKKLAAKTSKKKQIEQNHLDESSNSSEDMSLDHITVSTTDRVDSPSKKLMDKTDKDKTY